MLDVEVATLDLIAELKALMPAIRKHDRDLARQLLRAGNSIAPMRLGWRFASR